MLDILTLRLHVNLLNPFFGPKGSLDHCKHASNIRYVLYHRNNLLNLRAVLIEKFVDLLNEVELVIVGYDALEVFKFNGFVLDLMQVLCSYVVFLHLGREGVKVKLEFLGVGWREGKSEEFLGELLFIILDGALHF